MTHQSKIFNKKIRAGIFIFLFVMAVFYPSKKPAQAVQCWFIPCSAIFEYGMEILQESLLAILKEEGASMIGNSVGEAAQFVEDPNAYLNTEPVANVNKEFDDYLTNTLAQGRSGSGYVSSGSSLVGFNDPNFEGVGSNSFKLGLYKNYSQSLSFFEPVRAASSSTSLSSSAGNYVGKLVENAKKTTTEKTEPAVDYVEDPKKMFDTGTFKKLNQYASGINNPWAFTSYAETVYNKKVTEAKDLAKTNYIAGQGFLPSTDGNGKIKTPAITTKDIVSKSKTVGNDILADASSIPEAMITMILTMAASTITDGIKSKQSVSDKSGEKNSLLSQMDDLASSSQDMDAMADPTWQDILAPSLFRKLFGGNDN